MKVLFLIPTEKIIDNMYQNRHDYGEVDELASRIAAAVSAYPSSRGLMQVPRARITKNGELLHLNAPLNELLLARLINEKTVRFELAFGHRRRRAVERLIESGHEAYKDGRMPLIISQMTDKQMLDAVWSENYERKDISAVEQAELLQIKIDRECLSQGQAAAAWGLGRSTVANLLRLLKLPEELKELNRSGQITGRQAAEMIKAFSVPRVTVSRIDERIAKGAGWLVSQSELIEYAKDGMSSDELRSKVTQFFRNATRSLDDTIFPLDYDFLPGIDGFYGHMQSGVCTACPYRIRDGREGYVCGDPKCLDLKSEKWKEKRLNEAAEVTQLPVYEGNGYVMSFGKDERHLVETADCGNLCLHHQRYGGFKVEGFDDVAIVCREGWDCPCRQRQRELELNENKPVEPAKPLITEEEYNATVVEPFAAAVAERLLAMDAAVWQAVLEYFDSEIEGRTVGDLLKAFVSGAVVDEAAMSYHQTCWGDDDLRGYQEAFNDWAEELGVGQPFAKVQA